VSQKTESGCIICGAEQSKKFTPFCSAECADRDLANWLTGNYAIPAADDDEDTVDEIEEIDARSPSDADRIH
jgi:endogenous inhibitor of DNA gyrase (YacG/DUF329 family)